ncbi:hypothetical protein MPSEU_000872100 [Mayamaea pseudoterrestris]|nr:hypothetical protein MPSEU_000872100 [Mayamaea pseudoterrestris]
MGRRKHPRRSNDFSSDVQQQQQQQNVAASEAPAIKRPWHKKKQKKWHPRTTWMEQVIDRNNTNKGQPLVILLDDDDNNNYQVAAAAAAAAGECNASPCAARASAQQLTILMTRVLLEDDFWKQTTANTAAEQANETKMIDETNMTDEKVDEQEAVDGDGAADAHEEGLTAANADAATVMNLTVDSLKSTSTDAAAAAAVAAAEHNDKILLFCKLVIRNHSSCSLAPPRMPKHVKLLPRGNNGDGILNPYANISSKFWAQRHRLFSKYNSGVRLDEPEAWYSVTPEAIAHHVARRMLGEQETAAAAMTGNDHDAAKTPKQRRPLIILDAFCGWGGNSIAFGQHANVLVVAVDLHRSRLEQAAHNAKIYNVPAERLILVHANALQVMEHYRNGRRILKTAHEAGSQSHVSASSSAAAATIDGYRIGGLELLPDYIDAIFLSPPWGGPSYQRASSSNSDDSFSLSRIQIQKQLLPTDDSEIAIESGAADGAPEQMVCGSTEAFVNGAELLAMALRALPMKAQYDDHESALVSSDDDPIYTPKFRLAYFLPRNIDGVSVGRAAWQAGYCQSLELEQQYLQHKFKTVTAYF